MKPTGMEVRWDDEARERYASHSCDECGEILDDHEIVQVYPARSADGRIALLTVLCGVDCLERARIRSDAPQVQTYVVNDDSVLDWSAHGGCCRCEKPVKEGEKMYVWPQPTHRTSPYSTGKVHCSSSCAEDSISAWVQQTRVEDLVKAREKLQPWYEIDPADAVAIQLPNNEVWGPLTSDGRQCPWPWDPQQLVGAPIGQYHCGYCGEMVVAGLQHPDYAPEKR